jgi:predicted nucleotidyltransferase
LDFALATLVVAARMSALHARRPLYNGGMNIDMPNLVERRRQRLATALEQILHSLIAQHQPERVILFGSLARGEISEWSDIDLVIIKDTPLPFLQRSREVALLCQSTVGVDFLIYTPSEWAQLLTDRNPFGLEEIAQRGRILYERQPAQPVAIASR